MNIVATNNSWGGGGFSQALLDAITRGAKQNILFIAAAGNSGTNNDSTASYPSNYNTTSGAGYDAVIAVAAIDSEGALASFSQYGWSVRAGPRVLTSHTARSSPARPRSRSRPRR